VPSDPLRRRIGVRFDEHLIDIRPARSESRLTKVRACETGHTLPVGEAEVLVAAG
jgi:hypothetical protein